MHALDFTDHQTKRMKQLEEESRSDRVIEVETDDEEYEAERHCDEEEEDDTESDSSNPLLRVNSDDQIDSNSITWPQSYRLKFPNPPC